MTRPATLVTAAVLVIALLVLLTHLGTDYSEYSRYNPGWNGTSRFFTENLPATAISISNPADLSRYQDTLLLVIAPNTTIQGKPYRDFLERGNTIVLFDDFGTGNQLLETTGSGMRLRQVPVMSADRAYNDPVFVKVHRGPGPGPLQNISSLILDRPASVEGGRPLFMTSLLSWEDTYPDNKANANETLGSFVVGAYEEIGKGRLIVISDPGILINAMAGPAGGDDRGAFLSGLLHLHPVILVDTNGSMTDDTTLPSRIIHMVQTTSSIRIGILILVILIVFFGFYRKVW